MCIYIDRYRYSINCKIMDTTPIDVKPMVTLVGEAVTVI